MGANFPGRVDYCQDADRNFPNPDWAQEIAAYEPVDLTLEELEAGWPTLDSTLGLAGNDGTDINLQTPFANQTMNQMEMIEPPEHCTECSRQGQICDWHIVVIQPCLSFALLHKH